MSATKSFSEARHHFPNHLYKIKLCSSRKVLLEGTQELSLFCRCLVSTMTELGRRIDPFELNLLEGFAGGMREH